MIIACNFVIDSGNIKTLIACFLWDKRLGKVACTIVGKSSAPFLFGGDNLKWYFDQR